jgi:chaperonin GroEL
MEYFESFRFRSTVVGRPDELLLQSRVDELRQQQKNAESQYDGQILAERIGILTGGIAKIRVYGASSGELREKRDRTEDAVCAVRGASEHGVLPGGGWTLLKLARMFFRPGLFGFMRLPMNWDSRRICLEILVPSLEEPVRKLLQNAGKSGREVEKIIRTLYRDDSIVYDALEMQFVRPFESGILDSTPAVLEAIRNSLSIASLLGTLGGCVVFPRDEALERQEARETSDFMNSANYNEADERI